MDEQKIFELPNGAIALKKIISKELSGWKSMRYDATFEYQRVTWYRVYKGMSGDGRREDWVADLPVSGVSIHDYHWNGDSFGRNHGTIENAMTQELLFRVEYSKSQLKKTRKLILDLEREIGILSCISSV